MLPLESFYKERPTEQVTVWINAYHRFVGAEVQKHLLSRQLIVSRNSCFRTLEHEKNRKRSGNSEHTFINSWPERGACDWTTTDVREMQALYDETKNPDLLDIMGHEVQILKNLFLQYSDYRRIAIYPTFVHCDYKVITGNRRVYRSGYDNNWNLLYEIS